MNDIVEAAEAIHRFIAGVERETFLQNDLLRSAVLQKLTIIGEAVARLPMEVRDRNPEMEWDDIIGFRNIALHGYFAVEWPIVWVETTQEAPELKRKVADILAREFADPGPS